MKRLLPLLAAAFALAAAATPARPQQRTARPARPTAQRPAAPAYSDRDFDPSLAQLPPGFRGHDLSALFKALAARKKAAVKGEFETTAAFDARVRAEASRPVLGPLTPGSTFAFVTGELKSVYDADRESLRARLPLKRAWEGYGVETGRMAVSWDFDLLDKSTYTGTNAYGARVNVERSIAESYEIAFENHPQFPVERVLDEHYVKMRDEDPNREARERMVERGMGDVYEELKEPFIFADLKMDAATAMQVKPRLRALLVCRLANPQVIESTTYGKPTYDHPKELMVKNYLLATEVLQIWFFDPATGRVLARLNPAPPAAPAPPTPPKTILEVTSYKVEGPVPEFRHMSGEVRNVSGPGEPYPDDVSGKVTCKSAGGEWESDVILVYGVPDSGKTTPFRAMTRVDGALTDCVFSFKDLSGRVVPHRVAEGSAR
jgi:hypothetical protein